MAKHKNLSLRYSFLIGEIKSFTLENPKAHSIGVPLFLEFVSATIDEPSTTVMFRDDYDIQGKNIVIPHGKTVTGILLFDESGKWMPFLGRAKEGHCLNVGLLGRNEYILNKITILQIAIISWDQRLVKRCLG